MVLQTCNRQKLAACASSVIKMNAAMVYTTSIVEFGAKLLLYTIRERQREKEGYVMTEAVYTSEREREMYERGGVHHQRQRRRKTLGL